MAAKKIVLVDTDILIKVFRGNPVHKKHLDSLKGRIAISIITALSYIMVQPIKIKSMI